MSKGKMTRRKEREQAFTPVFQQLISRSTTEEIIDVAEESAEIHTAEFAERLVSGVKRDNAVVDDKIEKSIRGWSMTRLSKVSFALLRVTIYEMTLVDSIPVSVSINEAVNLTKKYGGAGDAPFISGVLGSVVRELEPANEER